MFDESPLVSTTTVETPSPASKDPFQKYRQYTNADKFAAYKTKLLESIEKWSQVAQRDILMRDLRRVRVRSYLREALSLDNGPVIAEKLRPLFSKVQTSYYQLSRNQRIVEKLERINQKIKNNEAIDITVEVSKIEEREAFDLSSIKSKIANKSEFLQSLEKQKSELENLNIDHATEIAKHIDEYAEAITFLQKHIDQVSSNADAAQKAQIVLNKLQGRFVADTFLQRTNHPNEAKPTLAELNRVIDQSPIAEIRQLETERALERWTALASRIPTSEIHLITDQLLSRIPLLNKPSIRAFLRQSIDNRAVLAHSPNIDRMVEGNVNTAKEMWDYTLLQDSRGNGSDSFLLTFARRADARQSWRKILEYGRKRREHLQARGHQHDAEVKLANKMERIAEDAGKLPALAPWHHPQKSAALRFIIDGLVIAGMAIAGAYAYDMLTAPPQSSDDGDDSSTLNTLMTLLPENNP
jgi:hypothetical protein